MQKTTTLKDFKVFVLKTVLMILVLSISFQVSFGQHLRGAVGKASQTNQAVSPVQVTPVKPIALTEAAKAQMKQALKPSSTPVTKTGKYYDPAASAAKGTTANNAAATDVPAMNQKIIAQQQFYKSFTSAPNALKGSTPTAPRSLTNPSPNGTQDVCTFPGSLAPGDATIVGSRLFRDGVGTGASCAGRACPGTSITGPFYYDVYTMQNLTCTPQCVTVSYVADGTTGDVFCTAYNGSFNPANVCTNYIADGGSSSLNPGGTAVSFSFTVAANQTIALVLNEAVANTTCDHYTMTVTGLTCTPPPPCQPATSSILSQVGGPPVPVNLINETFNSVLPAGWAQQNLSNPIGVTNWFQGNTAVFGANSGTGYIAANFNNGANVATISNWLFAPSVAMKNGDKFSFYTRTTTGAFPDRLQVRLNTTNTGTNVGSTETSVGDYNNLLLDINPTYTATGYPTAWTQYTITMSGLPAGGINGRLAFRYFVENGGPGGANSDYMGIDDVLYTTFSAGPVTTCTGSTANLKVDITGGPAGATYNVTIHPSVGTNFTVSNYTSGANIPVTPAVTTTYSLVSVIQSDNPCCIGTGNAGTPTITVSPTAIQAVSITANPDAPLCAGDPTLLDVVLGIPLTTTCITQSSSTAIVTGNSVACNNGVGTTQNSWWRSYNLASYPAITSPYTITSVTFGVELMSGPTQTATVNLWKQTSGTFPAGTRSIVATQNITVTPAMSNTLVTVNFTTPYIAAPTDVVTIELSLPDGTGTGSLFFIGSNTAAETAPSYISAAACGLATPGTLASVGFPGDHIILSMCGTTGGSSSPLPPTWSVYWTPAAGLSSQTTHPVAASPMLTTTYTVLATAPGGCQTSAQKTITVRQLPAITANPTNQSVCENGTAVFTAAGTATGATYQWQVSTAGAGGPWANVAGPQYSGANTQVLTINPATIFMNGYRYRLVVSGLCNPQAISASALLTVKALPVITITPTGPICGGIAGTNGVLITAGSAAPPVPGNATVTNSTAVPVPDNTQSGAISNIVIAGIPANATIVNVKATLNMVHTYPGDMIFNLKAPNGTILNLYKYNSGLATGAASGNATWGWFGAGISSAGTVAFSSIATAPFTYNAATNWKADLLNTTVVPLGFPFDNPTGYVSTATAWPQLYSTPNGTWTLAMADGGPGDVGTLSSWTLSIDYTTPGGSGSSLTYTWSPAAGLYNDPTATVPYVAGTQQNQVYAAPVVNTVYTVTGSDGTTGCSNTGTITVLATPPAPTVNPPSVAMCLGDPAAQLQITSGLAPSPFTTTYASGTVNIPIPDGPTIPPVPASYPATTSSINVPLPIGAQITNMRVNLNITHNYVGDLVIVLKAPNGHVFNLDAILNKTNNPGSNFTNTVISSTGVTALSAGTAPFTATFKPDAVGATFTAFGFTFPGGPAGYIPDVASFSSLYTGTIAGNWTLAIYDVGAPDGGVLNNWSLTFDYLYSPPSSGVWSPAAGLFNDPAATIPYVAGTSQNIVYARPTPGGVYPYTVTVNGLGLIGQQTFSNPANLLVPGTGTSGPGAPYPDNITVSGLPVTGTSVNSVTLTGISHTWESDMGFVLQSPSGQNVILMSTINGTENGGFGILNKTYTFSDAAATGLNAGGPTNPSGTYKCSNNSTTFNWPAPGPGTLVQGANPLLSTFTGNMNGVWKLYSADQAGGDFGNVSGGYSIVFNYPTPGCLSPARTVVVTVNTPVALNPALPVDAVVCTDKVTSFTVATTAGTSPTYQWQVSTDNGNTWNNISNGGVYAGATSTTLTITAPPVAMNGYLYRAVVSGTAPCGSANSRVAKLTVNPLPTIVLAASPYRNMLPGLRTAISSTVSPIAATYTWLRNGGVLTATSLGIVSGIGTGLLTVDVDGMGSYTLKVTDVNGCTNTSPIPVVIADSTSGRVFIYPNPNSGQFQVRYNPAHNNVLPRGINIYNASGQRILVKNYTLGLPFARMNVDLSNFSTGVYWVEVVDVDGNRLAMGRAEVVR